MFIHLLWTILAFCTVALASPTAPFPATTSTSTTPAPTPASESKIWAFLVAGSAGYGNYRHQADVCHAFQILKKNGVPEENIIVMMYDDVANNTENPTPGILINYPNGSDVYEGVVKDYTGESVTPQNFLNILKGDKEAMTGIGSGRVIESGPDDYVFVNFVDHGAPGILGFPNDHLHQADLIDTLTEISTSRKFKEMILYVEACESGSMFEAVLNDDMNIFVMTAADPKEPSYACYYDSTRKIFLGDVFSVMWMQEAEKENLSNSSMHHLFEKVRTKVNTSHVEEYGDLDIGNTKMSSVIKTSKIIPKNENHIFIDPNMDAVPQYEVTKNILYRKLERAKEINDLKEIDNLLKMIKTFQKKKNIHLKTVNKILTTISHGDENKVYNLKNSRTRFTAEISECYKAAVDTYSKKCFKPSEREFKWPALHYFVNACNAKWTNTEAIVKAINYFCGMSSYIN